VSSEMDNAALDAMEATELARQAEAEMAAGPENVAEQVADDNEVSDVQAQWDDLSADDQADILFNAVSELADRLAKVEMNLMLLGQSFVRILQKAGELPEEGSTIERAMVVPGRHASVKTRNSQ
jgi:hypothetical protein